MKISVISFFTFPRQVSSSFLNKLHALCCHLSCKVSQVSERAHGIFLFYCQCIRTRCELCLLFSIVICPCNFLKSSHQTILNHLSILIHFICASLARREQQRTTFVHASPGTSLNRKAHTEHSEAAQGWKIAGLEKRVTLGPGGGGVQ